MRMNGLVLFLSLGMATASGQEPPRFGGGVEVIAVDANVVDTDGKPVAGLTAEDFLVKVDGKRRKVVSADFVQLVTAPASTVAATPTPSATEAPAARRAPGPAGRRIVIVVDRGELGIEAVRLAADAASRLLDQLSPDDRIALFSLPSGPRVEFTDDRAAIRKALG